MSFGAALSASGGSKKCKFEMIGLDVTGASADSIEIAFTGTGTEYDIYMKPKGADAWATFDYRAPATGYNLVVVGGLSAGTEYQIKVAVKNAGVECDIIGPVTYSTVTPPASFDLNYRNWFSAFPAGSATVAAFYDNTVVERSDDGGATWYTIGTLQAQQTLPLDPTPPKTTLQGVMVRSRMSTPIGVNGLMGTTGVDATDTNWLTSEQSGKKFIYAAIRNNPQHAVIAAFEPLTYTLRSGDGTVVRTGFIAAGGFAQEDFNFFGAVIIETTGLAGVVHWSDIGWDGGPVFGSSKSLLGVASVSIRVCAEVATSVNVTYSKGLSLQRPVAAVGTYIFAAQTQPETGGVTSDYAPQSVYISADNFVSAQSAADGNGGNTAKAIPTVLAGTRTVLPFNADYLKLVGLSPFVATVTFPDGTKQVLNSYGGIGGGPYEQYIGPTANIPRGTLVETDGAKIVAWAQANDYDRASDQDETSLFMEK